MCSANKKAEVLRNLAVRSGDRARIDRLQTMVVCLGDRLGMPEEELWGWRAVVVAGEVGQKLSLEEVEESGFDASWLVIGEMGLVGQCCLVAEAWNRGWEADQVDLGKWVIEQVGPLIESRVIEAFRYAVDVILPMRVEGSGTT